MSAVAVGAGAVTGASASAPAGESGCTRRDGSKFKGLPPKVGVAGEAACQGPPSFSAGPEADASAAPPAIEVARGADCGQPFGFAGPEADASAALPAIEVAEEGARQPSAEPGALAAAAWAELVDRGGIDDEADRARATCQPSAGLAAAALELLGASAGMEEQT